MGKAEKIPIKISELIKAFGHCSFSGHWILFARWAKGKSNADIEKHLGEYMHTMKFYKKSARKLFGDTIKINDISIDNYIAVE